MENIIFNEQQKLLMLYKIDKIDDEYVYKFDSLALAELVDQNLIIQSGKLAGFNTIFLNNIDMNCSNILHLYTDKVTIANSLFIKNNYAYYEIPLDIINKLIDVIVIKLNKSYFDFYNFICSLGDNTKFILCDSNDSSCFKVEQNCDELNNLETRTNAQLQLMLEKKTINKNKYSSYQKVSKNKIKREKFDRSIALEKSNYTDIDVDGIISNVKNKIIGQDDAVESIVANIYANQMLIDIGNKDLISTQKASILIDGPTGTGKTAIIKEVANLLSLPIEITSSTSYSSIGYVGSSLTDILEKLLVKTKGDIELAQRGIICIDEIDKLGIDPKGTELKMRHAIQQELLSFLSGAVFNIDFNGQRLEFDTTNLTFIGIGAFTKIREDKIAENQRIYKNIGFNIEEKENNNTYVITEQDYINYGLERELIGRFSLLTSTKSYMVEDYKSILLNSIISPLKMFIEFAKSFGVEGVTYDDEFIEMLSQMAYDANFGARGLQKIITNLKNAMLLDIINGKNKSIHLDIEMLRKLEDRDIRRF